MNVLCITFPLLFEHVCFKSEAHNQICYFHSENNTFVIFTVKITECEDIEFYSKDKLQYFTVENVIDRGYSMHLDKYEI